MTRIITAEDFRSRIEAVVEKTPELRILEAPEDSIANAINLILSTVDWETDPEKPAIGFIIESEDGSQLDFTLIEENATIQGDDLGTNYLDENFVTAKDALGQFASAQTSNAVLSDNAFLALVAGFGKTNVDYDLDKAILNGVTLETWIEQWLPAWGAHHR